MGFYKGGVLSVGYPSGRCSIRGEVLLGRGSIIGKDHRLYHVLYSFCGDAFVRDAFVHDAFVLDAIVGTHLS